ncbi:alpha/beta hydrolase [Nonomuraea longicatena]|uniref:Alpha/beta hydrolase n=2 Tax=Nonomuraea longicatena TaxID=83682 RepID=A0ABP4BAN3_9ACTN
MMASLFTMTSGADASGTPEEPSTGPARFDSAFTHGMVPVDGGSLHYVKGGSGPVVVLLHGWPQTWKMWRPVMPALAREFTVVAIDLPGLGDSAILPGGYDKVTIAQRIRQAVKRLGFTGPVGIMGHDLGALIAYSYARDFPADVSRIAPIEGPLAGFGLEDLFSESWHFRFNMSPKPIPEQVLDNGDVRWQLGQIFDFAYKKDAIDREAFFAAYANPARRSAGYEYYRAFPADAANNQANASRRLKMPVAGVGGQQSFGPGVAVSFGKVADDVRTVIVPESGHFAPEENPKYTVECATLFFGPANGTPSRPDLAGCAP